MYFEKVSFGGAEDTLREKGPLIDEIEEILHSLNTVISWHGQTQLNDDLDALFIAKGWQTQVDSLLKLESEREKSGPKSIDYRHPKFRVDIEAEFGNVASFYRDVFKFSISKKAGQIEVGVIIVGSKEIAETVGENVSSYERFKDELSISWKYGANADCPVMLYGIFPISYPDKRRLIDLNAKKLKKELQEKRAERQQRVKMKSQSRLM